MKERTFKDSCNASDTKAEFHDFALRRALDGQRGLEHDAVDRRTSARVGEAHNSWERHGEQL